MMGVLNTIKSFFSTDDIDAKALSLLAAILLWAYVMTEQNPIIERVMEVPLKQINVSKDIAVTNVPEKVEIRMRGPRLLLDNGLGDKVYASIDLKDMAEGLRNIPVKVDAEEGNVVSVNPREVSAFIDTIKEKAVRIDARGVGGTSRDLALGNSTIKPSEVLLRGPSRSLENISRAIAIVEIPLQAGLYEAECKVVAINDDGEVANDVTVEPGRVMVSSTIVNQMHTVAVPVELKAYGNISDEIVITKQEILPKTVKITAPPSVHRTIAKIETKPFDLSQISGSREFACELELPDNVIPETRTVMVRFSVEPKPAEPVKQKDTNETKN